MCAYHKAVIQHKADLELTKQVAKLKAFEIRRNKAKRKEKFKSLDPERKLILNNLNK